MMQTEFRTDGIDIAVLTNCSSIISRLSGREYTFITEGILTVRIDILGIKRQREVVYQFDIHPYTRIRQSKGTEAHLSTHVHTLVLLKIRFTRREIDITCRTELTGGLEDIGFLTVKELDLLHVIQGETP